MNDFLSSIKADLLDRRLLPFVSLVVLALVGAGAYVVLGGGSSAAPPSRAVRAAPVARGIAVSAAAENPDQAPAETTSGAHVQRHGSARNPFTPLPGAAKPATSTAGSAAVSPSSSTTKSGGSSTTNSGSGSASKGETLPTVPAKPSKPRIVIRYHVAAQFGVLPPPPADGTAAPAAQLKTYDNLTVDQPIPAKDNPQLVFLGVVLRTGKDAVFGLTGEAILHGNAKCLPSPTHCQAIELQLGQSETLESFEANGNPVTYELKLVKIVKSVGTASASSARPTSTGAASAGRQLLRSAGLTDLPGLRYSSEGMLVPVRQPASAARAHA
ncbi:MAG: hypothetical protein JWM29_1750 [Solirubrobacterales bacterium]|nr:hypothetical protein [Solirubrobacterales bacterium]